MWWHEQTWKEIADADKAKPVVVPLGSCEQHGLHLPLFVDSIQVEGIAQAVNSRLGDEVLVLPTLWLGCSHHHLDFPGTVSLPPALYTEMIKVVTQCLLKAGFTSIFFLNGHGGNVVPVSQALTELIATDDRADAARLAFASWWQVAKDELKPDLIGMKTPNLTHACEYETSLVLALREDLVHLSRISPRHVEKDRPWTVDWKGKCEGFHRFHRWTSSGHMGEPQHATKAKGEAILEGVTETVIRFLKDFTQWSEMDSIGPAS